MKNGIELIAEERQRQINDLGYTTDRHLEEQELYGNGQLAEAAAYYAFTPEQREWTDSILSHTNGTEGSSVWPLEPHYFNACPEDRVKELTKAGALIAAEIDRLQQQMAGENPFLPWPEAAKY